MYAVCLLACYVLHRSLGPRLQRLVSGLGGADALKIHCVLQYCLRAEQAGQICTVPACVPTSLLVVHIASLKCNSRAARALIPDDDDEELIEKAKANRKKRLASEKEVETEFKKSGGFAEGEVGRILSVYCTGA